ncbi:MAG: glycoside hydrolase family 6 protein [Candidatus Limnocylindrales bacterium]
MTHKRAPWAALFLAVGLLMAHAPTGGSPATAGFIRFYAPPPNPGATQQIAKLRASGRNAAADRLAAMVANPQAVWVTWGTPAEARDYVANTVAAAQADGSIPIFVAYNVPGRDCSLYSAGGAANGNAYRDWIDGFVQGLGQAAAVVIVEPDGLSLLPSDCGQSDPYDRVGLISYAAHAFLADANASVYIDAGNSNWNPVGLTAQRLVAAGVADTDGFALNVSNFQYTQNSNFYGTWVSKCVAYGTGVDPGIFDACPDQYGSWGGVPLSSYGIWSNNAGKSKFNVAAENARYSELLGATKATAHFVVDTSRNAVGPWKGTTTHPASNSNTEAWCNPPNRGAGMRPTPSTGISLVDAYLWVKLPGESDGECYRWTSGPKDPLRGIRDPSAGAWFKQMARELADQAIPAFP